MTDDPIRKYSTANDELDKALAKIQQMRNIIAEVGQALLRPYELIVSNVKSGGFPAEVVMGSGIPSLNAQQWPTAEQIAEVLADLHKKRHEAENTWGALSEADRKLVKSLPPKR